jgi:hypothetical protein
MADMHRHLRVTSGTSARMIERLCRHPIDAAQGAQFGRSTPAAGIIPTTQLQR